VQFSVFLVFEKNAIENVGLLAQLARRLHTIEEVQPFL